MLEREFESSETCNWNLYLYYIDLLHLIKRIPLAKWIISKFHRVSQREYSNTIYNILTGYDHYQPPSEIVIPPNCYYNPYLRGMVTTQPPFLKAKMLEYEDGVAASVPQMAYDLTEFMSFLKYGRNPDRKFEIAA